MGKTGKKNEKQEKEKYGMMKGREGGRMFKQKVKERGCEDLERSDLREGEGETQEERGIGMKMRKEKGRGERDGNKGSNGESWQR